MFIVMKYIKEFESYSTEDIIFDLSNYLRSKNFSPVQINKIIDSYSGLIHNLLNQGGNPKIILNKVIKLLPETIDDNFLQVNRPSASWRNTTYL